jgi:hypothetical protein
VDYEKQALDHLEQAEKEVTKVPYLPALTPRALLHLGTAIVWALLAIAASPQEEK